MRMSGTIRHESVGILELRFFGEIFGVIDAVFSLNLYYPGLTLISSEKSLIRMV